MESLSLKIKSQTKNNLELLLFQLPKVQIVSLEPIEFMSNEFRKPQKSLSKKFKSHIDTIKSHSGYHIYRYSLVNKKDEDAVHAAFVKFKKKHTKEKKNDPKPEYAVTKLNETEKCEFLYVGCKIEDHHKRFKEHLGFTSKTTYSMHMRRWIPKNIMVKLEIFSVKADNYEMLEFIEQGLWAISKPMFGKKSGH
jgi:hypothetical protein